MTNSEENYSYSVFNDPDIDREAMTGWLGYYMDGLVSRLKSGVIILESFTVDSSFCNESITIKVKRNSKLCDDK